MTEIKKKFGWCGWYTEMSGNSAHNSEREESRRAGPGGKRCLNSAD